MKVSRKHLMNKEDTLISRITLSFLFTPLLFLVATGAIIAA